MSAEDAVVEALKLVRQENARLQAENARLREVLSTYPERQQHIVGVLAEMRGLLWQLTQGVPLRRDGHAVGQDVEGMHTGIPPAPEEQWWPTDLGPTVQMHDAEPTQVEIPQEPEWPREEAEGV